MPATMSRELDDIRNTIASTLRRGLVLWAVRWSIGFALVGLVVWLYPDLDWLWIAALIVALLSLSIMVFTGVLFRRRLGQADAAQQALVPEGAALRELLLGRWAEQTDFPGGSSIGCNQYRDDGRFFSTVELSTGGATVELEISGHWEVRDRYLVWTAEQSSHHDIVAPGMSEQDLVLHIDDASMDYQDPQGEVHSATRRRKNADL